MSARVSADFLIVGSGIAGLRAGLALAPHGDVVLLTKANPSAGSTAQAQGGVAAAVGPDDSPELHAHDTIAAGDGLCDEAAVRVLVDEGPRYVRELIDWGVAFDRGPDGRLALAREGAHSVRRVLHARDATGRAIGRVLAGRLFAQPRVTVLDHARVVDAVVEDDRVTGVCVVDAHGETSIVRARATLIATGGAGHVFSQTTNPAVATGDGIAIGYRAGARVMDLEFVQFHPTVLDVPGARRFLLSEALRGEGAALVNDAGERFMTRYDPAGDLAPRDRVARAIVLERARTAAPVFLTLAHLPAALVHERFPHVSALCATAGLDLAVDRIPIGPAAHYLMGGLATDRDGRTSLRGLFAAGEVACTGVHGANRLASNSLLEGLVFGARAGDAMRAWLDGDWPGPTGPPRRPEARRISRPAPLALDVGDLMWRAVGIFRDAASLGRAVGQLDDAWDRAEAVRAAKIPLGSAEYRQTSLVTVGRLIARAALRREESRGAHSRTDFPEKDDLHWLRHVSSDD